MGEGWRVGVVQTPPAWSGGGAPRRVGGGAAGKEPAKDCFSTL